MLGRQNIVKSIVVQRIESGSLFKAHVLLQKGSRVQAASFQYNVLNWVSLVNHVKWMFFHSLLKNVSKM